MNLKDHLNSEKSSIRDLVQFIVELVTVEHEQCDDKRAGGSTKGNFDKYTEEPVI